MEARAQDLPVTKELIDDENPHKFAIYWVSGIYKVINYNMRNVSLFSAQCFDKSLFALSLQHLQS